MSKNFIGLAGLLILVAGPALAQDTHDVTWQFSMNTLFILLCGILVMWMAAGFTMLEVGLVRTQSIVSQCAKNMGLFAIASFSFLLVGYGMMFPEGNWLIDGFLGSAGSLDIGLVAETSEAVTDVQSTEGASVFFNMMFCCAVASIVSGSLAERIKLMPFFLFTAVMTALIYPIQASWAWGGGFLYEKFNFQDLAGSTVIHVVGGVSALTGTIFLGSRLGRFVDGVKVPMASYSLPLATLGALILWMGWFGFNAGSYLSFSSDADAVNVSRIMINTNTAACAGAITAAIISYLRDFRFDLSFMINGALGGLVAITADPLYPGTVFAALAGMSGGLVVFWALALLDRLRIDDVVGAIPVHLFCGILGTLLVPFNNPNATFAGQTISVAVVVVFVGITTAFVWMLLDRIFGLRVSEDQEMNGLDKSNLILEV